MHLIEVKDDKEWDEFILFPFELYRDNPYWVPGIKSSEKDKMYPGKSVFVNRFKWKAWLVKEDQQILGRLLCNIDRQQSTMAKFGWWDVVNDLKVSKLLFDRAVEWAHAMGANELKGPLGFTNLDKTGLMTAGFDHMPTIAENYNAAYYKSHLEKLEFQTASEYISYIIQVPENVPSRITKMVNMLVDRYGWQVRVPRGKGQAQNYAEEAFALMNASHAELEEHTVLTEELSQNYIESFLPLIKTNYSCFVYKDELLIGFGIALPNYSKAFQKMKGKIWPYGWWHLFKAKWFPKRGDLLIIGVHPQFRNKGVTACLFENIMKAVIRDGVQKVESNPELKENESVQRLWSDYNPVKGKEWKTFIKSIGT